MRKKLTKSIKFGWGIGSTGPISMMYLISFFAVVYMSTYLGISPTLAGFIVLLTKLFNMITDPAIGILSDKFDSKWGRRRPFMLVGAICGSFSVYLFFNAPQLSNSSSTAMYISIVVILYFTAYTTFNVTYLAMPAEMTDNLDERTSIMTWRVFFVSLSGFLGLALAPFLIWVGGEDKQAYGFMGTIMALTLGFTMLYSVYATRNAPFTCSKSATTPLSIQLKTALDNKPFVYITTAKFLQLLGLSTVTASLPFLTIYIIGGNYSLLATYGLCMNLSCILAIPLWRAASKITEKKYLYVVAISGSALTGLTWFMSGANELTPITSFLLFDHEITIPNKIYLARCVALGIFTAGILLMGQAMVPDAIAEDYKKTGLRREGMFSSVYSFVEKLAFSLGPLIAGAMLDINGFKPSTGGSIVEQSESAIRAIYLCVALIPAIAAFSSVPFILKYKLIKD